MTIEQIQQSATLVDNALASININRNAHLALAKALSDLKAKAETAISLQFQLENAKKEIELLNDRIEKLTQTQA